MREWPDGWWDHWWNHSPILKRQPEKKADVAQPGAGFWYEHYWKPRNLGVWAYELVRRLVKLRQLRTIKLTKADLNQLKSLPPYPKLEHGKKNVFLAIFFAHMDEADRQILPLLKINAALEEPWLAGQPNKLGNWCQIEDIDAGADEDKRTNRKAPISYMERYWRLILFASRAAGIGDAALDESKKIEYIPLDVPTEEHELTGFEFSEEQVKSALKRIKA